MESLPDRTTAYETPAKSYFSSKKQSHREKVNEIMERLHKTRTENGLQAYYIDKSIEARKMIIPKLSNFKRNVRNSNAKLL